MTLVASQSPRDCVIVAIANATGKDYDVVKTEIATFSSRSNLISRTGIDWTTYTSYLKSLGWYRLVKIPRRGQNKIWGIVRLISNKNISGHLVYIDKNGLVYDLLAVNGMPLVEYQRRYKKCHVTEIWHPIVSIVESIRVESPAMPWLDELFPHKD